MRAPKLNTNLEGRESLVITEFISLTSSMGIEIRSFIANNEIWFCLNCYLLHLSKCTIMVQAVLVFSSYFENVVQF